ncbi:MAG TPA: hypothetical protein VFS00_09040 [Polyangiaceae bacterium]|nr:hypothetical protein [Polyangiaceae bacterium]
MTSPGARPSHKTSRRSHSSGSFEAYTTVGGGGGAGSSLGYSMQPQPHSSEKKMSPGRQVKGPILAQSSALYPW